MASNHTANYGLSQWEPGDSFLRTEFNADNARVDAALTAARAEALRAAAGAEASAESARAAADRALEGLVPVSYNVCNLALRDYYERKETGWKQAVVFDGFLDLDGVESLTPGLSWTAADKFLLLDPVGVTRFPEDFPHTANNPFSEGNFIYPFTAPVTGRITAAALYLSGSGMVQITTSGGILLSQGAISGTSYNAATSVGLSAAVIRGESYRFAFQPDGTAYLGGIQADNYSYQLTLVPETADKGTAVTVLQPLGRAYQGVRVWVRHSSGTVTLSLWDEGASTWRAISRAAVRDTTALDGTACKESAFALEGVPGKNRGVKLKVDVSAGGNTAVKIFDYGAVVM